MTYTETIVHVIILLIVINLCYRLYRSIDLSIVNLGKSDDMNSSFIDRLHLIDHLIGAGVSFCGAAVLSSFLIVELLSAAFSEFIPLDVPSSMAFVVLLLGFSYQAWHLEREETEGHPFFHWVGRAGGKRRGDA